MVIRAALLRDAQELALLGERLWRETYSGLIPIAQLETFLAESFGLEQQVAELADPAGTTLALEVAGRLHGYAWLRACGPVPEQTSFHFTAPLEVARFYVDQTLHGTGAAQALMSAVLTHAVSAGRDGVWLQVWEENLRALRFYAKAGFVDAGETRFRVGDLMYRDRLMTRTLIRT